MGKEYTDALQKGFNGGWIDVYENKGKRSGAYSWGAFEVIRTFSSIITIP